MYMKFDSSEELAKYINLIVDKRLSTQYISKALLNLDIETIYVVTERLEPSFYGKIFSGTGGSVCGMVIIVYNCENQLISYNLNKFKIYCYDEMHSIYYYDVENYNAICLAYLTFVSGTYDTNSIISTMNSDIIREIFRYFNIAI